MSQKRNIHKKYLYTDDQILEPARVIHSQHPHYYALIEGEKINDQRGPSFHAAVIHNDGRVEWRYVENGMLLQHYYDTDLGPGFIDMFENSDPEFVRLFREEHQRFLDTHEDLPLPKLFRGMHYRELLEFFLRDRYYEIVHDYDEAILEYLSRMEFEEDREVFVNASSYLEHEKDEILRRMFYEELRDLDFEYHYPAYKVIFQFLDALRENADDETNELIDFITQSGDAPQFFKRLCLHLRHLQG